MIVKFLGGLSSRDVADVGISRSMKVERGVRRFNERRRREPLRGSGGMLPWEILTNLG